MRCRLQSCLDWILCHRNYPLVPFYKIHFSVFQTELEFQIQR
ncbi:unnamed protein product [Larinioides sclopetarius]|uniref:Uncharacterized protein n=1 Tax=Larinioides sclopetarius TaxID=280406 RepID=A0AAV2BT90_9ARAC